MPTRSGHSAVILVVDDDEGDRELTRRAFARSKIHNDLYCVDDAEQALDYLKRQGTYSDPALSPRPDLVLLDLNMPRRDGRYVLEEMRKDESLRHIPVVVMTISDQETDIVRSSGLVANACVVKPVDISQFARVIATLQHYWLEVVVLPRTGFERDADTP